jgi:lipopolysaccharide/colanic/teichoic acid biosynthesis glycosyltransferase
VKTIAIHNAFTRLFIDTAHLGLHREDRKFVTSMPYNYQMLIEVSTQFRLLDRLGLIAPRYRPTAGSRFYALYGKRAFDVIGASLALIVASPLLLVSVLVWLGVHGRPVLFRQVRVGFGEKLFKLKKLRSMTNARDSNGELLPDDQRTTALGDFFRKWSIDELPQLLNVLSGEMSLVGPRPLLVRYIPRYTMRQRRRNTVKPGISGLAQALGGLSPSWEQKLEADVAYANSVSVLLDLAVIILTVIELGLRIVGRSSTRPDREEEFWGRQGPPREGPLYLTADESGD